MTETTLAGRLQDLPDVMCPAEASRGQKKLYALCDPRIEGADGIRYIGLSCNPERRYSAHLSIGRNMPARLLKAYAPVYRWIRGLKKDQLLPALRILQDPATAADEMRMVRALREKGAPLLNVQPRTDNLTMAEFYDECRRRRMGAR